MTASSPPYCLSLSGSGGLSVSNVAASVNGVAWLLAPGLPMPFGDFRYGDDLSQTAVSPHHITVAPFWSDLTAQPYGTDTNTLTVSPSRA
jgi:hypothetical protein